MPTLRRFRNVRGIVDMVAAVAFNPRQSLEVAFEDVLRLLGCRCRQRNQWKYAGRKNIGETDPTSDGGHQEGRPYSRGDDAK